jgi:tetratricopeptide (TPR) repeat protein
MGVLPSRVLSAVGALLIGSGFLCAPPGQAQKLSECDLVLRLSGLAHRPPGFSPYRPDFSQDIAKATAPQEKACWAFLQEAELLAEKKASDSALLLPRHFANLSALRPALDLRWARVLAGWGRVDLAKKVALDVLTQNRGRPLARDRAQARLLLADLALGQNDWASVITSHRALLKDGVGDAGALRFNLMRALSAVGKKKAATLERNRLLVGMPRHTAALKILTIEGQGILNGLSGPERLQRVRMLLKTSRPQQAAEEALAIPRPAFSNSFLVDLEEETVRALVRAGRLDEALTRAQELAAAKPDQPRWWAVGAWALGKAGRTEEASARWAETARRTQDPEARAEACFFSGFLRYEGSRYEEAERIWLACAAQAKGSSWQEATLWYRGLVALLQGKMDWAAGLLEQAAMHHPASPELSKYLHWRAHALSSLGQKKQAKALWLRVWQRDALSYYGMLARQALEKKPIIGTAIPADALMAHARRAQGNWANRSRALARFGLDQDAKAEVLANPPLGLGHLGLLQEVGAYHDVWRRAARVRPHPRLRGPRLAKQGGPLFHLRHHAHRERV